VKLHLLLAIVLGCDVGWFLLSVHNPILGALLLSAVGVSVLIVIIMLVRHVPVSTGSWRDI